jgi:hypothetical protein
LGTIAGTAELAVKSTGTARPATAASAHRAKSAATTGNELAAALRAKASHRAGPAHTSPHAAAESATHGATPSTAAAHRAVSTAGEWRRAAAEVARVKLAAWGLLLLLLDGLLELLNLLAKGADFIGQLGDLRAQILNGRAV